MLFAVLTNPQSSEGTVSMDSQCSYPSPGCNSGLSMYSSRSLEMKGYVLFLLLPGFSQCLKMNRIGHIPTVQRALIPVEK